MNIYGMTIKTKEGYLNVKLSENVLRHMFDSYEYFDMVMKIIENSYKAKKEVE